MLGRCCTGPEPLFKRGTQKRGANDGAIGKGGNSRPPLPTRWYSAGDTSHDSGQPPKRRRFNAQIELIAPRSATVLIEGETGAGKEDRRSANPCPQPARWQALCAGRLHGFLDRADGVATVWPREGAFTGAVAAALGFVRCADGGTLFLDEIGELPLAVQAKLLRCIQERAVVPVGGVEPIPVDLRIIAATHRDLAAMVREGRFRQDLYFRFNVVRLAIRPLRQRATKFCRWPGISSTILHRRTTNPSRVFRPPPRTRSSVTIGPATSASCAMPSNEHFCSAPIARSTSSILPDEVRERPKRSFRRTLVRTRADRNRIDPRLADAERLLIARVLKSRVATNPMPPACSISSATACAARSCSTAWSIWPAFARAELVTGCSS